MPKTNLLVISAPEPALLRILEPLRATSDVFISDEQAEVERLAAGAEVMLVTGSARKSISLPTVWPHAQGVRWVHSLSAGVEKLMFPALAQSSVPLTNARGVYKRSLAEFAVLGVLFHYKRVRRLLDNQRAKRWDQFTVRVTDDRVMGIVGYGQTGRECALLARGLGMRIHALRRNPARSDDDPLLERNFAPNELQQMLRGIDVLLCATPLTTQTRHMISDAQFDVMKPGTLLINVGRGPVVDETALIRALRNNKLAGASLDVFEEEPLPQSSPLWDMDNVLISPHCTDWTEDPDALELTMRCFVENFHRYQRGEPLQNIVDKSAGY
jgi:phosphoglycerate dehydrogenase-like enzyme